MATGNPPTSMKHVELGPQLSTQHFAKKFYEIESKEVREKKVSIVK